jgi:hypothetical protein
LSRSSSIRREIHTAQEDTLEKLMDAVKKGHGNGYLPSLDHARRSERVREVMNTWCTRLGLASSR